jgi:hypothetical protein
MFGSAASSSNNLKLTTITPELVEVMIDQLKAKGVKSEDLKKYIDPITFIGLDITNNQSGTSNKIIDFLVKKGLTPEQSAGIAGNLYVESGFNTTIPGDNGTSIGLAQWHSNRMDRMIGWLDSNGYELSSIVGQLSFLWWELNNYEKNALDNIKSADSPTESANIFARYYERPLSKNYTKRERYAEKFYDKYNDSRSKINT